MKNIIQINKIISKFRNKKYYKLFYFAHDCFHYFKYIVFSLMKLFIPNNMVKSKIVTSSYYGDKYDDNTKYIVEELHRLKPDLKIVWLKSPFKQYQLPDWIKPVDYESLSIFGRFYEYLTAKVWVDTHHIDEVIKKRKNQLFIETWHGGLGIKKIELDIQGIDRIQKRKIKNTSENADIFISNSKHLSDIYRRAFGYKGRIWEIGYPKNDCFFQDYSEIYKKIRDYYGIDNDTKLILYAPTFRDNQKLHFNFNLNTYNLDSRGLCCLLEKIEGHKYKVLKRMHPFWCDVNCISDIEYEINVTDYSSIQELIMASDLFISDYSSCIFDAALAGLPCFIFATDFKDYQKYRDTYFKLTELPFPIAESNEDLFSCIRSYDSDLYQQKWKEFKDKTGLVENGLATKRIAEYIINFIEKDIK